MNAVIDSDKRASKAPLSLIRFFLRQNLVFSLLGHFTFFESFLQFSQSFISLAMDLDHDHHEYQPRCAPPSIHFASML